MLCAALVQATALCGIDTLRGFLVLCGFRRAKVCIYFVFAKLDKLPTQVNKFYFRVSSVTT